ncbi:MAG TPA: SH3 domain-containing protein [Sphingomicrobium sp.]|nr:SH3 domain-containing protein [Sphingomicrobium sp.]
MARRRVRRGLIAAVLVALAAPAAAQDKTPPYWASIASGEAMMRTGPGRNYPGIWLYKRRDLPVRVVKTYPNWRMIEDPDGARGWMLVSLLSDQRTAIVRPGEPRAIHVEPDPASRVRYRAEHGVVGRIDRCGGVWCRIAVGKRQGYIRMSDIWGVGENEKLD